MRSTERAGQTSQDRDGGGAVVLDTSHNGRVFPYRQTEAFNGAESGENGDQCVMHSMRVCAVGAGMDA